MIRAESFGRLLLTLFFTYLFTMGATFNGVLFPELKFITLGIITISVVFWLFARWRGRWTWYRTPLDMVFILWSFAFAVSLLANLDSWRRIVMGLWYVSLYMGVWFVLQDALANRAIKIESLVDAYLIAGVVVVGFGFFQLSVIDFELTDIDFPRLVSTVGNPNALGAFMVVLILLIVGRLLSVRVQLGRIVLSLYLFLASVVFLLTFSRGAYLGFLAAILVFVWLYLDYRGLASRTRLAAWWRRQRPSRRRLLALSGGLMLVVGMGITLIVILQTINVGARDPGLRGAIYSHAVTAFAERPLTGHGLFTFGKQLARLQSQPPELPHSHAHNVILHIGAELGLIGLIVLTFTLVVMVRTIYRNWQVSTHRPLIAAAAGSIVGFGIIHLFDTPSMMPLIALIGLLMLVIAMAPPKPERITARWRLAGHPVAMIGLWGVLIVTGLWSANVYARYNHIVRDAVTNSDFRAGADALQSVVDADPDLGVYVDQQAYLYGVAASEGDEEALQLGIRAYKHYLDLEPQDSVAMVNLAALYEQAGRVDDAVALMLRATEISDKAWQYYFIAGNFAEEAGDLVKATALYKRLTGNNYNLMYPGFDDTAFRRAFRAQFTKPIHMAAPVLAIMNDEVKTQEDIDLLWQRSRFDEDPHGPRTYKIIIRLMLYLHSDLAAEYEDQFDDWLAEAQSLIKADTDKAWMHLGRAEIARYYGDEALAQQERAEASEIIAHDSARPDFNSGSNVGHFQFLRVVIPRQFLPQVNFPSIEELPLLRLLDES